MFSLTNMPSTTSVFAAYTSFAASLMMVRAVINEVRTMINHLIPQQLQEKLFSMFGGLFGNLTSQMIFTIDEYNGPFINEVYKASEVYLSTISDCPIEKLKVSKSPRDKEISFTINEGQEIIDVFDRIKLKWEFVSNEPKKTSSDESKETSHHRSIKLSCRKSDQKKVKSTYFQHVVDRSKAIKEKSKVVKLYSHGNFAGAYTGGSRGSVDQNHPSTFKTLAMDPEIKQDLMDDLDKFKKSKEFYQRVGRAWKRGYLLYGPPGTGKSSLIAAMANYLKYDIYDLELTSLRNNLDLRRHLLSTTNQSIIVIEDIDCSMGLQDRQNEGSNQKASELTLSGLLNCIDGLWSCCGEERIIVFTTNYKEKLDPALLRPGRMDKHIHMSYCTPSGFKILASNYLEIESHDLFAETESLIQEVEVTPAKIAEELMKSENADIALKALVEFLRWKKGMKCNEESKAEGEKQSPENEEEENQEKQEQEGTNGQK